MTDVYIIKTSSGRTVETYHPTNCRTAPDAERRRTITEAEAKKRDLNRCDVCSGTAETGGSDDPTKFHDLIEQAQRNDPDLPNPQT